MTDYPPESPSSSYLISNQSPSLDGQNAPPTNWDYEAAVADIEAIISRIEMGELDLAELFDQFAIAVEQLQQCETFLTRQQQQVDLLIETLLDEPETF
jgi:exodeoxyribonuclease VII small subunit